MAIRPKERALTADSSIAVSPPLLSLIQDHPHTLIRRLPYVLIGLPPTPEATQEFAEAAQISGRQCLLARRLVERGVRFIELSCMGDLWDQHANLVGGHKSMAMQVDQPIAGLISDLKSRGLLDETLVIFVSEF